MIEEIPIAVETQLISVICSITPIIFSHSCSSTENPRSLSSCPTKITAADADTNPCNIGLDIKLSKNPTLNIPNVNVIIPHLFNIITIGDQIILLINQ